jgi:hypothetical protein
MNVQKYTFHGKEMGRTYVGFRYASGSTRRDAGSSQNRFQRWLRNLGVPEMYTTRMLAIEFTALTPGWRILPIPCTRQDFKGWVIIIITFTWPAPKGWLATPKPWLAPGSHADRSSRIRVGRSIVITLIRPRGRPEQCPS